MTDKASKIKGLAWLTGALGLGVLLALGLSPVVRAIPWSWEQHLSNSVGNYIPAGKACWADPQKAALFQKLVARLYPLDAQDGAFSIEVQVVRDKSVNAFAGLGGHIVVNSGLLQEARSPEEVAGVLAHEIEHVRRRHVLEGFMAYLLTAQGLQIVFSGGVGADARWTDYFLHMGFSRSKEAQADAGALERLRKGHIDNRGFRDFFERLKGLPSVPALLSDHPSSQERFDLIAQYPNQQTEPIMTRQEWESVKDYCQ